MPTDPDALAAELTSRGLTLLGAFVPVAHGGPGRAGAFPGVEAALQVARLLPRTWPTAPPATCRYLALAHNNASDPGPPPKTQGRVTPEMGLTDAEWEGLARPAPRRCAGAVYDETGLRTVFHHHCAGYVRDTRQMLAAAQPDRPRRCSGWSSTPGHYAFAAGVPTSGWPGAAVADGLRQLAPDRHLVHPLQGLPPRGRRPVARQGWDYFESLRHGVFCELGTGVRRLPPRAGRHGWKPAPT